MHVIYLCCYGTRVFICTFNLVIQRNNGFYSSGLVGFALRDHLGRTPRSYFTSERAWLLKTYQAHPRKCRAHTAPVVRGQSPGTGVGPRPTRTSAGVGAERGGGWWRANEEGPRPGKAGAGTEAAHSANRTHGSEKQEASTPLRTAGTLSNRFLKKGLRETSPRQRTERQSQGCSWRIKPATLATSF